jgi:fused signal recognition particle receptor
MKVPGEGHWRHQPKRRASLTVNRWERRIYASAGIGTPRPTAAADSFKLHQRLSSWPGSAEKPKNKPQPAAEPAEAKAGLRQGLAKTWQFLNTDIRDLFKAEGRLVDEDFLRDLYAVLVKTDMGAGPADRICQRVGSDFRARMVHMREILEVVKAEIKDLIAQPKEPIAWAESGPTVVMVVGVNGSGKTTSIAKLARRFHDEGKKVVLGAGDTFRAAAVEQLSIWGERVGCEVVKGNPGGDPASVAYTAVARTLESGADVCIVDTAGRLQTQTNLMQQLEKIHRVMAKHIPEAPHETLLVLDATAGQNAISQARGFSDAAKCTGIILAKLDGTAKGGVIIPIRQQFNLPVKFIGVGEKDTDLAIFDAEKFADAMFREEMQ